MDKVDVKMADFVSSLDNPPMISSASSSRANVADHEDDFKDACGICLEPYNSQDPPTVTKKQRVPYMLAASCLEGPFQLLAAVENERNLRSRHNARHEDNEMNIVTHRARHVERRGRPRSSGIGPPLVLLSVPPGDLPLPDVQHMRTTSPEECQTSSYEFSEGDSPTFSTLRSVVPEAVNVEPNSVGNRNGCNKPRVLCSPESPQRPSSSEFLAFSGSVKSKFSVASARYKESISKSTRGFKEKLLAHNISVRIGKRSST
ncbi:unnamed protein product [Camellia sinensis]